MRNNSIARKIGIVLLLVGALLLTGYVIWEMYYGSAEGGEVVDEVDEEIVTMVVQESHYYLGLERMIKKLYVEEEIRVEVEVIPDEQADSIIRMKVNAGAVPDILDYNIPAVYGLLNPPVYLENLSEEPWVRELKNPNNVTYENGKTYAFPLQEGSGLGGVIYNETLFEELGLKKPTTEEEFHLLCDRLLEEGVTPILLCGDKEIPQKWMEYGLSLAFESIDVNEEMAESIVSGEKKLEDYPEYEIVIDEYLQMFELGYVNEDYLSIDYETMIEYFSESKGAMIAGDFNLVSDLELANQDMKIDMFPIPFEYNELRRMAIPTTAMGCVVFKDGENKEVAKQVLELWSTPEYLELWFMDQAGMPAFYDVESISLDAELLNYYYGYLRQSQRLDSVNNYMLPLYDLQTTKLWFYYMEAPRLNQSAADILNMFQQEIDEYIEGREVPE